MDLSVVICRKFYDDFQPGKRPKLVLVAPVQNGTTRRIFRQYPWPQSRSENYANFGDELGISRNLTIQLTIVGPRYYSGSNSTYATIRTATASIMCSLVVRRHYSEQCFQVRPFASAFRFEPKFQQAANCFGTRGIVILGLCPEVQSQSPGIDRGRHSTSSPGLRPSLTFRKRLR